MERARFVRLEDYLWDLVKKQAKNEDRTITQVVKRMILKYVEIKDLEG